jgi:hypothetical protein
VAAGALREAVASRGVEAIVGLLADDVVFRSPVVHAPYEGSESVGALLGVVAQVFEDFRYVSDLRDDDTEVLLFEARVGDRDLQGIDFVRWDDDGRIAELTVFVRPMSGLLALAEAMRERLEAHAG